MVLEIRSETEFFVIMGHFSPFYPPNDPKKQNFEKRKKISENIVLLLLCNINKDHTIYGS